MVEYRPNRGDLEADIWSTCYWKLPSHEDLTPNQLRTQLAIRRFPTRQCLDETRLQYLLSRAERGMISYENCEIAELQTFCTQRKITAVTGKTRSKSALIALLESADENQVFTGPFDLPAEMRNLIYEYSFDLFDLERAFLPPPPLAAANRLLRSEVAPLFYDLHEPVLIYKSALGRKSPHFRFNGDVPVS